jgi:hypothetical protein
MGMVLQKHAASSCNQLIVVIKERSNANIIGIVIALDVLLVLIFVLTNIWGYTPRILDLNVEASIPTWYSAMKLFVIAQLLGILALVFARRDYLDAVPFLFLGLLALILSMDEVATIHERYARHIEPLLTQVVRADLYFSHTGYWMLVLGPILAASVAIGIWLVVKRVAIPQRVAKKALLGLAVFFVSAAGLETLSNSTLSPAASVVQIAMEEGGEMVGVSFMIWALLDLLADKLQPAGAMLGVRPYRSEAPAE